MIQPVGAMVQPPNPNQGLSQLSSILGFRQAQQNLQTGAINQQNAQALLQQNQQDARQRQAAANFFQNYDVGAHVGEDGTLDLDQALTNPQLKATGDAYPVIAKSLIDMKNAQLDAKTKLAGLNGTLRQQFYDNVGGLSNDPDVKQGTAQGAGKVLDAIDEFSQSGGPDAERVASVYKPLVQNLVAGGKTAKLPEMLSNWQLQALDAAKQREQTYGTPTTVDNGGIIQPGVQAPAAAGGGFTAAGTPIKKAPEPIALPTGQIGNRNPATGALSLPPQGTSAPTAAVVPPPTSQPMPNLNPTRAQVETQQGLAKGVTERVSQAQAAANNTSQAQDALSRARAILDNPEGPDTGAGFENKKAIMNFLSSAGIDTKGADDANTLAKNLARYEAARATQAGLGGTDAARELAHNGSPNVSLDNKALKGVVTQSLATEKALAAYAGVQSKTQDPGLLAKNESDFRNIPNLIEGYEYGLARNPKEADEFLKRHGLTKEQMIPTWQKIKEFESRGQ
jgi:hypothetical protein